MDGGGGASPLWVGERAVDFPRDLGCLIGLQLIDRSDSGCAFRLARCVMVAVEESGEAGGDVGQGVGSGAQQRLEAERHSETAAGYLTIFKSQLELFVGIPYARAVSKHR